MFTSLTTVTTFSTNVSTFNLTNNDEFFEKIIMLQKENHFFLIGILVVTLSIFFLIFISKLLKIKPRKPLYDEVGTEAIQLEEIELNIEHLEVQF